jgi:hypothetical protein
MLMLLRLAGIPLKWMNFACSKDMIIREPRLKFLWMNWASTPTSPKISYVEVTTLNTQNVKLLGNGIIVDEIS